MKTQSMTHNYVKQKLMSC